jgi:hypothetical protein
MRIIAYSNFLTCVCRGGNEICFPRAIACLLSAGAAAELFVNGLGYTCRE